MLLFLMPNVCLLFLVILWCVRSDYSDILFLVLLFMEEMAFQVVKNALLISMATVLLESLGVGDTKLSSWKESRETNNIKLPLLVV